MNYKLLACLGDWPYLQESTSYRSSVLRYSGLELVWIPNQMKNQLRNSADSWDVADSLNDITLGTAGRVWPYPIEMNEYICCFYEFITIYRVQPQNLTHLWDIVI